MRKLKMFITAVSVLFFIKFQDMAKQINNFKIARRDRIECEKLFSKTQVFHQCFRLIVPFVGSDLTSICS